MRVFIDDCAYPEYVYRVPVMVELVVPRFRTEKQKLLDAYLDAIIPASFKKKSLDVDMPMDSVVDIGWDKWPDPDYGTERFRAWLLPNDFCEAKEKRLIMDVTISLLVDDCEGFLKDSLAAALRRRK
jgi:hypothetical protein